MVWVSKNVGEFAWELNAKDPLLMNKNAMSNLALNGCRGVNGVLAQQVVAMAI